MVGREHFSGDRDSFMIEYNEMTAKLKEAGKQLEPSEASDLSKAMVTADFSKGRDLLNTYRKKYLPPAAESPAASLPDIFRTKQSAAGDERLDKLEELVTDARKRLSAIEGDIGDKKKIADSLQQRVEALKMIPPPVPSIKDA
jgi:hypothetical protein